MITEHARTVQESITASDLEYLVKRANQLGKLDRQIVRVFMQEDAEGKHIYFECESPKNYDSCEGKIPC
jgi:hypothetical protein